MRTGSKNKTTKSGSKKINALVDSSIGSYEKHPFFVKKANEAKQLLKAVGLPKNLAKAK